MREYQQFLKKTFLKNPHSPIFWLLLGLLFKGILFFAVIINHPFHDIPRFIGATQGDDSSYLVPIDNLLQHGAYTPDFRMPGYGAVYLLFRFIFSQAAACDALIFLQLLLASVGVYCLALTAKNILKTDSAFYLTFYLFLLSTFSNFFDAYIASESLCTSVLIFGTYFFTRYFDVQKNKYLFYAGLFLTWATFIRPVFGGIVVLFCFILILRKQKEFVLKAKQIFFFLISFILVEGTWVYRNYEIHNKIVPFTSTGNAFYPEAATGYMQPLFEFCQSWGGVCTLTDKPPDINWFHYYYIGMAPITNYDSLPDNIYTSKYNKDSLMLLRSMIVSLRNPAIDSATTANYNYELRRKLKRYKLSFSKERSFTYYIKAPLKITGVFLYGPETKLYLERGKSIPGVGEFIILFNNLNYLIILLLGIIGSIGLMWYGIKQSWNLLIIPLIPLYTILIHSFVFRLHYNRYLMPAYPFLIICSVYLIDKLYKRYYRQRIKG